METNAQAALNWLRKAAQAGDATYLYDLARVLETQPEGKPLAADLYQQAADLGHQEAAVSLAVLYQNGTGVAQDFARALQLYEGPAAGQARAQNNLGLLYVRGNGVQQDYVRAAALFQAAADQGLALAMGNLATMYENGFGVPLDEALAVELHQLAARKNSAKTGNLHPGWVFDTRLAPPDSSAEALERLRQGVTRGDPLAGFLLGWHHLQKTETSQEEFRQAARLCGPRQRQGTRQPWPIWALCILKVGRCHRTMFLDICGWCWPPVPGSPKPRNWRLYFPHG
ncbi:sel1 repeat family protein (plasmid) [Parasedimentitalea marina]|uniref:Sel1 repeat family protein n=1 Tax=Parasedimentitalea marina TaxID=2483033 RepID=A0A3T0N9K2_9RHOB|nr:tetratricopeptide repeat protein [Parasedimentitalea marina]AZV80669.1 sel1 repeat family protein [Parasedimentitalea marina]